MELQEKLTNTISSLDSLSKQLAEPNTVKDHVLYAKVSREYSELKEKKQVLEGLIEAKDQISEAEELSEVTDSPEMKDLAEAEVAELEERIKKLEAKLLELEIEKDPLDEGSCIMEIRAGAGGEESALFASELFRAYSRFAEEKGLRIELASSSESDTGGFKEIIFFINGADAYGTLKFESGVHRVQRVPATESSGRIHTSAVSVVVLPDIPETEVEIDESDLRIDYYRSSGPGGQSVNTTDSAVRIVHEPTGIVVTCQDEKSQHKNKAKALKILQAKLFEKAQAESANEIGQIRKQAIKTGDRSAKIRTYNFPQSRVTDHRIKQSWHNLESVMQGDFGEIVEALRQENLAQLQAEADSNNKNEQ